MKKFIVSCILCIFCFSIFSPVIYAVEEYSDEDENIVENEVVETEKKENIVEEDVVIETPENIIENEVVIEEPETVENTTDELDNKVEQNEIEQREVDVNVSASDYSGFMFIDTPSQNSQYVLPNTNKATLSGWAVSNDTNAVVKLYVNNVFWRNIERTDRLDVNRAYPQYIGTTPKAGYSTNVDISQFPEGVHTIKVEQVSRFGKVMSKAEVRIQIKHNLYLGTMFIDTPKANTQYTLPNTNKITLSGWAISNDTNAVVKLYVNNVFWRNIERTERLDVNRAYPQYIGTTPKAGYSTNVDISQFPEGVHTIKVEQVSRFGKVISRAEVRIQIKHNLYLGTMFIDTPKINSQYNLPNTNKITLSGWAISNDTNAVVKLYVNNVYWKNLGRVERIDVSRAYPQFAGTTPKAGYSTDVDISQFPEGVHTIKVEQVSRFGKVMSIAEVRIRINTPNYSSIVHIDSPIQNKIYAPGVLKIEGWAITTSPGDYVGVYLDGNYLIGAARTARSDVLAVYGERFGLNSSYKAGVYSEISTAGLSEGRHTLKLVQFSKYGKAIGEDSATFTISRTTTWGIDVSHYQGTIDWNAVKNSGVNFAILKIGEYRQSSGATYKDSKFDEYYNACKSLGIAVGGYFYSYAFNATEAANEANSCLSIISGKSFEMPIFFDIEDHIVTNAVSTGQASVQSLTDACITFCSVLNANGYQSGVYSYRNFFYQYLNMSALENYNIWLAHYVSATNYSGKYDVWQYTDSGSIPGISGAVDLNWCFRRYY